MARSSYGAGPRESRHSPAVARQFTVVGAPSSAGAFARGQEEAPGAMREAGLLEALAAAGVDVRDDGDVRGFTWAPDHERSSAMHVGEVGRVALEVAERVETAVRDGRVAVVLGGDCTVGIGTYLGLRRVEANPSLVYLDPHPDLNTPDDETSGALDWMGVAHLLGRPGAVPELVHLDGHGPALDPRRLVLLGASPARSRPAEREAIAELGIFAVSEDDVIVAPAAAAQAALERVGTTPFALHFDSDCIDFAQLPICENTDRNVGLSPAAAMEALTPAASSPHLRAVTITEVNPHHGAPDGSTVREFVRRLAVALTGSSGHGPAHDPVTSRPLR